MKLNSLAYGPPLLMSGLAILFVKQGQVATNLSFEETTQHNPSQTTTTEPFTSSTSDTASSAPSKYPAIAPTQPPTFPP